MNLSELQADLRHFAAERDWQPFHTPKNLSTALMVEAAELAEIFQWMTPEGSRLAHEDPGTKDRIGEEVADVLLYLMQLADHSQIDLAQAVTAKLARNALKYPATRSIARASPTRSVTPGTHVLVDYENVQPTDDELRRLVPDASQVWVFHGPHQRQIEQRYASFGVDMTAVPISKTGNNALDFHLSFYVGYLASRYPTSTMVVVANDKGYEPMLKHARSLGFSASQVGHGRPGTDEQPTKAATAAKADASGPPAAKKLAAKKAPAKKTPATKAVAKKTAVKPSPEKKTVDKKASAAAPATKKPAGKKAAPTKNAAVKAARLPATKSAAVAKVKASTLPPEAATTIKRLTESLRKMGDKRPAKLAALRRSLKSFLGAGATDAAAEVALACLVADGAVKVDPVKGASYPRFNPEG